MFLIALSGALFVGGIPGVLFARLLCAVGLPRPFAIALGSMIIPVVVFVVLAGPQLSNLMRVPWLGIVAPFVGGLVASYLYFRPLK